MNLGKPRVFVSSFQLTHCWCLPPFLEFGSSMYRAVVKTWATPVVLRAIFLQHLYTKAMWLNPSRRNHNIHVSTSQETTLTFLQINLDQTPQSYKLNFRIHKNLDKPSLQEQCTVSSLTILISRPAWWNFATSAALLHVSSRSNHDRVDLMLITGPNKEKTQHRCDQNAGTIKRHCHECVW